MSQYVDMSGLKKKSKNNNMKIYKAYLRQSGEGCDYTIGCGRTVIHLNADSMEDAKQKLAETIKENYDYSEGRLQSAELYEIGQVFQMDVQSLYQETADARAAEKQAEKDKKEKEEFERLKVKFGN